MELYKKYRPQELDDVVGNETTIELLQKQLEEDKLAHAHLFIGDRGCGKTTTARILAKELGGDDISIKEINGSDKNGVDDIREIIENCKFQTMNGKPTVYIYDECHMVSNQAQSAFLKLLEDTPPHVYFLLATTNPEKLSKAVKSRCQIHKMETLKEKEMVKLLFWISKQEKLDVSKDVLMEIYDYSEGSPRTAIQMLEKASSVEGDENQIKAISGATEEQDTELFELAKALIYNTSPNWKKVAEVLMGLKEAKADPEGIRRFVLGSAQNMVLKKGCPHAANVIECFSEPTYDIGFPGITLAAFSAVEGE